MIKILILYYQEAIFDTGTARLFDEIQAVPGWELFPFSFWEFLSYHLVETHKPLTTTITHKLQQMFDYYWENGGFPEVASLAFST